MNGSAWFLFAAGVALKGTVVLGAAWLIAFLLRRRSAATRHLVWTAAAAALLVLPFLSVSLPAVRVPMPDLAPSIVFHADGAANAAQPSAPALPAGKAAGTASNSATWRPDPQLWLMAIWAAGAALALVRMAAGYVKACRLRQTARPFPKDRLVEALGEMEGIDPRVRVFETRPGSMPANFGVLHPAIFLPRDASEWSDERLRIVLLHELAHVRRGDVATHLLARTAFSLHWWNPLAWAAWRRFLKERERAADDLVLMEGARASDYAAHLLDVARSHDAAPATAWAAVAMARRSEIEGRLLAILDSRVDRTSPGRIGLCAAVFVAAAIAIPIASIRAQEPAAPRDGVRFRAIAGPGPGAGVLETGASPENAQAGSQRDPADLDRAAASLEAQHRYGSALELRQSALAVRGEIFGKQSREYQTGLLQLGDFGAAHGKLELALDSYREAAALGDNADSARALVHLAIDAYGAGDWTRAESFLHRAQAVARGADRGRALTWMAVVREQQGAAPEAESLYQQALAAEDPTSPDADTTLELYARFLRKEGRDADAESAETRAHSSRTARIGQLSPKRADGPQVSRVGGGTTAPMLVFKVEPAYTVEARAAKLQGTVVVYAVITSGGRAADLKLLRGLGLGLDESAIDAISQWHFKPGTKDGQPVPVAATIEVNFRLQ
jgi:TonB family protein